MNGNDEHILTEQPIDLEQATDDVLGLCVRIFGSFAIAVGIGVTGFAIAVHAGLFDKVVR